jgi:zinc protease
VKQYLRGSTLRQTDGPFNRLSLMAALNRHGLKSDFTGQYLNKLEKITPEEILTFAIQWLNPDDFFTVTAGEVNQSEIKQEYKKQ